MSDPTFRVQQIDHVELFVPDQHEAAHWYRHVLGLEILPQHEHWASDGGPLMISSDEGSTMLALFVGEPRGMQPTAGFHRVAFRVDGPTFMQFIGRLSALQLTGEHGKQVSADDIADHEQAYSIYFCDPHGHRFEITTYEYDFVTQARRR
ncbi:MAG: VOC family protein [Anaerolineae bacterium]|nr:VOC family protein [Anaerolineae bacterium]MCO5206088.1 VOC family protein [Anaerolineae bacterium]